MSAAQVGYGLYGALLVEDPADGVGVADQATLVLSDIGFDSKGTLEDGDSGGSAGMVFGREGAYVLVNGETQPTLQRPRGAPQRWRIVNAAKSRFFYLDLDGQDFLVIGQDGGLQERPTRTNILLDHTGRARGRDRHANRRAGIAADAAGDALQPRLRQRRISQRRRRAHHRVHGRAAAAPQVALPAVTRAITAAERRRRHAGVDGAHAAAAGSRTLGVPHQRRAATGRPSRSGARSARRSSGP